MVLIFGHKELIQFCSLHSKAWGGYVFICFAQMICFYLALKIIKDKKNNNNYPILMGIISALAFWSNMQSLYYAAILMVFFALVYLRENCLKIIKLNYLKNLKSEIALSLIILFNFYFILNKRLIFNPAITLNQKFGFDLTDNIIRMTNFDLKYGILLMWIIYILWTVLKKHKDFYHKILFDYINFLFIGIYINVYFNSFSRVSAEGNGISNSLTFLNNVIFAQFFGAFKFLFIGIIILGVILNAYKFIKHRAIDYQEALFLMAALIYPLMFVFSNVPGLTITARYLIIWWPICISYLGIFVYKYIHRNVIFGFAIAWMIYVASFQEEFLRYETNMNLQRKESILKVEEIKSQGFNYCAGDYWKVGLIMFYSKMDIKCWTDKNLGANVSYLDDYKAKYSKKKTYLIN